MSELYWCLGLIVAAKLLFPKCCYIIKFVTKSLILYYVLQQFPLHFVLTLCEFLPQGIRSKNTKFKSQTIKNQLFMIE